ncbi:hypothetical protein ABTW96_05080 [Nocardia beijingensis]|uniref:hypothetical protein n=1 Tax=Nocardia beijingensis TaxID=95162 RepID=UPI00331AFFDA
MRQKRRTFPKSREFGDLSSGLSDSQKELAQAVRGLIERTGLSSRAIEDAIAASLRERGISEGYLSKSVLSKLANGGHKRPPREAPLRELHTLAVDSPNTEGTVISWGKLNRLRLALSHLTTEEQPQLSVPCPTCGTAMAPERGKTLEQTSAAVKPAETVTAVRPDVVPVPHYEGDRHNSGSIDVAWPPAKDLAVYISAGNFERVNGLIRYIGTEAPPDETANAVVSCRELGLDEATEIIIGYAGGRSELDVLQILQLLLQRDQRRDADILLERALASLISSRSS